MNYLWTIYVIPKYTKKMQPMIVKTSCRLKILQEFCKEFTAGIYGLLRVEGEIWMLFCVQI